MNVQLPQVDYQLGEEEAIIVMGLILPVPYVLQEMLVLTVRVLK